MNPRLVYRLLSDLTGTWTAWIQMGWGGESQVKTQDIICLLLTLARQLNSCSHRDWCVSLECLCRTRGDVGPAATPAPSLKKSKWFAFPDSMEACMSCIWRVKLSHYETQEPTSSDVQKLKEVLTRSVPLSITSTATSRFNPRRYVTSWDQTTKVQTQHWRLAFCAGIEIKI